MTEISNKELKLLEQDLRGVTDRFDRHLEIYANNGKELAALKSSVDSVIKQASNMEKLLREGYVSVSRFRPVEIAMYGFIGIIMVTVIGAMLALIVRPAGPSEADIARIFSQTLQEQVEVIQ